MSGQLRNSCMSSLHTGQPSGRLDNEAEGKEETTTNEVEGKEEEEYGSAAGIRPFVSVALGSAQEKGATQ